MSKFKKKLGRRIMAVALSVAMIMSNMTVYADELTSETQVESSVEEVSDDVETVEDVANNDEKETSSTQETAASEKEDDDAVSEDADEKTSKEDEKPSEKAEKEDSGKKNLASDEEEKKTSDVDNKAAIVAGTIECTSGKDGAVSTVEGLSEKGITATNFTYNGSHGFKTEKEAVMKMTLTSKANISIQTCQHNSGSGPAEITSTSGKVITENAKYGAETASPKFHVLGAEAGEVTLTFSKDQIYIHTITVEYTDTVQYTVKVTDDGNGTASASPVYGPENTEVTLTATPKTGYGFKGWQVISGGVTITDNKFTIGTSDVEVKAVFEATGPRTAWDFTDGKDTTLYEYTFEGSSSGTGEVAGLKIDATSGKFSTTGRTSDGNAAVNATTKISVPVTDIENDNGVYVTVQWYSAGSKYTIGDTEMTSAARTAQTVACKGTNGYVDIELKETNNYLEFIKIEPIIYVAEGTEDFMSLAANSDLGVYNAKGISVTDFLANGQKHGIITNKAGATVTINLEKDKVATITIESCQFNETKNDTTTPTSSSGTVTRDSVPSDPKFIVSDAEGRVVLTFPIKGTYIHNIKVNYKNEGGEPVVEDNEEDTNINFAGLSGYTQGTVIDSLKNGKYVFSNVKWNDAKHGISVKNGSTISFNLKADADGTNSKAEVSFLVCSSNGTKEATTIEASADEKRFTVILDKDATPVEDTLNFAVLRAEGKVTIKFTNTSTAYIHAMSVKYTDTDRYAVTVSNDGNGEANADKAAASGGLVTLTANAKAGYQFKEWQVIKPEGTSLQITQDTQDANKATFTMPQQDVEIKAIFEAAGVSHKIEIAAADSIVNGTVEKTEVISAPAGANIKLADVAMATPAAGYILEKWQVTYKDGEIDKEVEVTKNGKEYSFTMPDADVLITPVFIVKPITYFKTTYFGPAFTAGGHKQKDLVDDIDGFETIDGTVFYNDKDHGLSVNAGKIKLTLTPDKKYDITVWGCGAYGTKDATTMTATWGENDEAISPSIENNDNETKVPKFVISDVENEVVLIFGVGTAYIHSIIVDEKSGGGEEPTPEYSDGIDVWDFGAEKLDETKYKNHLTEEILNAAYPEGTKPGTSGVEGILSFTVKDENGNDDFKFDAGGKANNRLRTTNTKLTRKDEKSLTIGDVTYTGYIYSNSSASSAIYVGVKLNAGDIMTAVVSSNGGNYTITVEDPDGSKKNFAQTYSDSQKASVITYYATKTGMHKIYNGTDEKLVVARVTRQHSKAVNVSGKVTIPEGVTEELKLIFTCRESGMVRETTVTQDGGYSVELFENYHYDVVVNPAIYVIEDGAELTLGEANETQTYTHDIKVGNVTLRKLSGSIVGLDDAAMNSLKINFVKPEDKIYLPTIEIDKTAKTYTALLESGVEYTMITEGINDYELDNNANNNSDRIRLVSDATGRNITYVKKPVYKVTINPIGATLENLADAKFIFTNLKEEGYVYTFTGTDDIQLRDGTYSVTVSDSGIYVQMSTPNLVIDGDAVTKEIRFNSDITEWLFSEAEGFTKSACEAGAYKGLKLTGVSNESGKSHAVLNNGSKIEIPVKGVCNVEITYYYRAGGTIGDKEFALVEGEPAYGSTSKTETEVYKYTGDGGYVELNATAQTFLTKIEVKTVIPYVSEITVDPSKDASETNYKTINDALSAIRKMERTAGQVVTVKIAPGDYEEMLVIDQDNIKFVNAAGADASIGLRNKGVNIDANAVRITSYYGHGYAYYSMGSDCKWNAEILETNKANGSLSFENPGTGTTSGSYWNATVVINASNVSAEGIIFENSFNQYVSKKAAEDVIVPIGGAKEGAVPRASMAYGDTTVQQKEYVERAAALAIYENCSKITFDNCKFIGRQDTLYGGVGTTAAFYNCAVYGGTDYIFGGMTAVFAKCDLVFNTNDQTDKGKKDDVGYITAAQQKSGRGYLMYNCHVTSTMPGVDTASQYTSKPGYLGRPWEPNTGEAVFYKTIVDEADEVWRSTDKKDEAISLILPAGWNSGLGGKSVNSKEYDTYEISGVDNQTGRVNWATTFPKDPNPYTDDATAVTTFLGDWDAFAGKDMTVILPDDENAPAPTQPKAIVSPKTEKDDEVIKDGTIVLAAQMGAKIYYNVNADSNPTETPDLLYKDAINVTDENIKDNTITIKAIAVKYGKTSDVATFTFKVVEAPTPDKPVLTPASDANVLLGSSIKMAAAYGAKIYYNVNAEAAPTEKDTLYTGKMGVKLTLDMVNKEDSTVKIQAIAVMTGKTSEATTAVYNVTVNKPVANLRNGYQFPDGGGKVKLTADEDVTILYTTGATAEDAADPTLAESNPMTYDKEGSGIAVMQDTTIKAVAKRGSKYSTVVTLSYLVPLSMPTATPESGSVLPKNGRTVLLSADEGTTIYYTFGADSDPTTDSEARMIYDSEKGIEVTQDNTTIKAVAVKDNRQSVVASFTYTISEETFPQAETPTVTTVNGETVAENTFVVEAGKDVVIKLETATEGAEIYYTTNNKIPTTSSDKYNVETGIVISAVAEDTIVKAIAVKTDFLNSEPLTFTVKVKTQGGEEPNPGITVDDKAGIEIVGLLAEYEYTGAAITPDFDVVDNGIKENGIPRVLVLGTDYTVKYKNNKKDGETATVTVVGKGNYSGKEVEGSFLIKSMPKIIDENLLIDVKGAKIAKISPIPYDGLAQYPDIELTPKGGSAVTYKYDAEKKQYLKADGTADINVTISGNRNKGTATILVTGKKDAKNGKTTSVKATFKITPVDLSLATVTFAGEKDGEPFTAPYAVKGAAPKVIVTYTFAGKNGAADRTVSLVNGRDYTVKYSGNKKADATGKVVISGKGNYTKKAPEKTFTVGKLSMENTKLVAAEAYDGAKAAKLKAVVVDANGDALKASQYTVKAYTDKECKTEYAGDDKGKCKLGDEIYVQVTAKDTKNLVENSTTLEPLEVKVGANIAKAKIKLEVKSKAYTGTYVQLAEDDLTVTMKVKGVKDPLTLKLKPAKPVEGEKYDFEIISYSNNINKGTASAVIRGIGDYSGTKTIKFKIASKEMKKAK